MAYAGALGETDARYFDTTAAAGPVAHPLFSVCYEWPLAVELRERAIGEAIAPFSVHATHDVVIHRQTQVPISGQLAHVYTECARIWNPIHTDIAVARKAGLPGLILHGTATLALAVSRVVARELHGDPGRVRGVAARFTGMVAMPSVVTVRGYESQRGQLPFDVVDAAGHPVLGRGVVKA